MEELLELLKECLPTVDFSTEKTLVSNKTIDSMDLVNVIYALETHYDISIEYDMICEENFDSAEAILALVQRLKQDA